MPDNQVVLLLPLGRNSRRTRVLSHSVSPLAILRTTGRATGLAVTSLMMLGFMAQLSGFAMATDYTTTQHQSLQIGDTITTMADGEAGYGLMADNNTLVTAPGDNVITTSGYQACGICSIGLGAASIAATGTKIITTGAYANGIESRIEAGNITITLRDVTIDAQGVSANGIQIAPNPVGGGTMTLTTDDKTVITATGTGVNTAASATLTGTHITNTGDNGSGVVFGSIWVTALTQIVQGNAVIKTLGYQSLGVWSTSKSTQTPVVDDGVSVETFGKRAYGVGANASSSGLQVNAATVVTHGDTADGARAMYGASTTLNGTHVTTHGANAAGAAVGNAPFGAGDLNNTITITGATLTTTGDGSNAVQIYGPTNNITMDNATVISTTGVGSHAISIEGGATKTYGRDADLATDISVTGKDSAVFHAVDTGSVLTVSDVTLNPTAASGADTWTAIAENGGTIDFANIASGIKSIWAKGADANTIGTVVISGQSASLGDIRARVDANGLFVLSGLDAGANFAIASLEGDGGNVDLGTTNLTISGDAKTSYAGTFEGTGAFIRSGTVGSTTLTGDNSAYTSAVSVTGGSLYVNGQIGGAATVTGGTLGGSGTIGGDVSVAAGGNLAGRQGQVLTIQGNLALDAGSTTTVALGAPEEATASGLFNVAGDVTLAGKLNVTDLGGFGPGLYRLVDYGGTLSDNGMTINDVPDGLDATQMSIQTSVASEVNLINRSGADLSFWDGSNMANHGNGAIDGGTGTWKKGETNWTDTDGTLHGNWSDGQFAMFTGTAGTVTVDNSGGDIVVDGMQFAVDGYRVEGDAVTLQDGEAIIRVGVGNGSGKGMSATIASELKGTGSLNKQDYGTLILTADNSYAGGTTISEGTLQLGDGGTAGSVQGDILNNATLAVNRSDAYKLSGKISGSGALAQNGTGTLILTGDNSYTGGTTISAGTLQLGDGGTSGSISGTISNDGILAVNRSDKLVLDGSVGGTGALQQNGTGTTVLAADNSYSGGTTINAGTLQLGNGGTSGSIAGDVANNGTLSFNRSDQLIFSKAISGTGSVTQDGAGTTLMTGANTYSGATRVNAGTLQQKMSGSFSAASDYTVAANATLDNGGYKTTLASLNNSGTVNFGTNPGAVVNITGNYTGNGGMLVLNTVLGDDSSKTDLLKVGGDTSGTSTVKVINRGGIGAKTNEGIKIISVGGQSNGTFNLAGDYTTKDGQQAVVAGAYAYSLHEGGVSSPADGDWYLRSELKDGTGPIINPGVPLYQGAVVAMQTLNKLPTLQQRVGNRYWDGAANPVIEQGADAIGTPLVSSEEAGTAIDQRGIWGRIEGAHSRLEPNGSGMKQDINTYLMQAGVDGQFYEGESGKLIGGITGQYGNAHSDISSRQSDGDVETQGWGLGGTLTWYGDHGFYVDTQAQANWYDNDFNSTTANKSLANGRKGFGYALSAETGQRFDLNNNWSLTPQAQLMWSSIRFDGFSDVFGTAVALNDGDSLTGRIGISADYRNAWRDANGQLTRTSVYGIANLYQEFLGDMSVKVAGTTFGTGDDKTWGGLGAGGTYAWADDKYALYGEGSINTSLTNFADSYSLKATIGFRTKW